MRIAILNITAGGLSGGYKQYLRKIVPSLALHPIVAALMIAVPDTKELDVLLDETPQVTWVKYKPSRLLKQLSAGCTADLLRFSPDVIFIPTARSVSLREVPIVTMIRNMEPIGYNGPNPLTERMVNFLRREEAKRAVRRADRTIAVSNYVKRHLVEAWGLPEKHIGVVYHGMNTVSDSERPNSIPEGWNAQFLFTAGSIRPARGLEDILRAFAHLSVGIREQYQGLVIAGSAPPLMTSYFEKLKRNATSLGIAGSICWTGNLNERQMTWCYRNCVAFVMTSRVEACPNIALEAMAHGCVIVSTKSEPMPEFFGDGVIYYREGNDEELAAQLKDLLFLPSSKKAAMRNSGFVRASKFTWQATTEGTVQELVKALEMRKR